MHRAETKPFRDALWAGVLVLLVTASARAAVPIEPQWSFSGDGGKTFTLKSLPPVKSNQTIALAAEGEFQADAPAVVGGVTIALAGPASGLTMLKELEKFSRFRCPLLTEAKITLNGKGPVAFPDVAYESYFLDGAALVKGKNRLSVQGPYCNAGMDGCATPGELVPGFVVKAILWSELDFELGPVLGAMGPDYIMVTCRTNLPATVTARATPLAPAAAPEIAGPASPRGLYHSLRLPLPKGTWRFSYTLTAVGDRQLATKTVGPFTVALPDLEGKTLRFVAMGQSDGGPWPRVAAAAKKTHPDLTIHTGTLNYFPQLEPCWSGILGPPEVRELTSTAPFYAVRGSSEYANPVFSHMFARPNPDGKSENWSQTIGPARFVGIDSFVDWSAGTANVAWLESVLKDAKEKFIFVVSSYPAYSSARWVRHPNEIVLRNREVVLPLLSKYKVTALLSAYGHQYERCEVPAEKGVTCIVTAASGGITRKASGRAGALNPYSTVYVARQHFCLFEIEGDVCKMSACDMGGVPFDKKEFKARYVPAPGDKGVQTIITGGVGAEMSPGWKKCHYCVFTIKDGKCDTEAVAYETGEVLDKRSFQPRQK